MNRAQIFFASIFGAAAGYASWLYMPAWGVAFVDSNRPLACVVIGVVFMVFLLKIFFPLLGRQQFMKDWGMLQELDVSQQKKVAPREFKPLGIDEETTFGKGKDIFCTSCGEKAGKGRFCKSCGAKLR